MSRKLLFAMDTTASALLQANPKEFYAKALLGNTSSQQFRQILGVKEKTKIGSLSFGNVLTEADCDFVASNSELDAKTFEPCKIALNVEICQFEIEQSFLADWMKTGSNGDFMPADFASHFYDQLALTVNQNLEYLTWQGDTDIVVNPSVPTADDYLALCDGLIKQLCRENLEVAQEITGTTVTSSNVIAELTKVYNAIPKALKSRKAEIKWFISQDIADAYALAVATQNFLEYTTGEAQLKFLSYQLVVGVGMPDSTQTLSLQNNYIFIADMVSDPSDITTIDMKQTTGDRKIRAISDFKIGYGILNPTEWVVYGLTCTAS
jgi:hypothetical protein